MRQKVFPSSLLAVEAKERRVACCGSAFGVKDRHGDIIPLGAYRKTITERGPGGSEEIFFLDQHRVLRRVNRFKEADNGILEERDKIAGTDHGGLYAEIYFPETILGNDLLLQYEAGVIRDHSVGIDIVQWDYNEALDAFILSELKLWEISAVTWGANPDTPVIGVKQAGDFNTDAEIKQEISALRSCLKEGLSDDTAKRLELGLAILEAKSGALSAAEMAIEERRRLNKALKGEGTINEAGLKEALHHLGIASRLLQSAAASTETAKEQGLEEAALAIDPELNKLLASFTKQFENPGGNAGA